MYMAFSRLFRFYKICKGPLGVAAVGPRIGPNMDPLWAQYWTHMSPIMGPLWGPVLGPSWVQYGAHDGPTMDPKWGALWAP